MAEISLATFRRYALYRIRYNYLFQLFHTQNYTLYIIIPTSGPRTFFCKCFQFFSWAYFHMIFIYLFTLKLNLVVWRICLVLLQ